MIGLELSPDNKFAAAYTNNNQTILLNTLISEFTIIQNFLSSTQTVQVTDCLIACKYGCLRTQGMCLLDTNVVIYGQFTWGVFDLKAKLVEQKQYEGEGEILRWIFCKNETFGVENSISFSMKTLDTLDSYSLVTWSGSQEDPNMV